MSHNSMEKTFYNTRSLNILYFCDSHKKIDDTLRKNSFFIKNSYVADNKEEVIDIFFNHSINCILLESSYWVEVAEYLRLSDKKVPIVVISSFEDSSELFSAIDLKIDQYIKKPYDSQKLVEKIEKISTTNSPDIQNSDLKKFENQYSQNLLVCKMDEDSKITYANDKLCKIFGYKESELIGKEESIFWFDSEVNEKKHKQMYESLKKNRYYKSIAMFKTKMDNALVIDITCFAVSNSLTNPTSYVLIYSDITEVASYRKLLEGRLNSNKKSYKEKNHFYNEYQKALSLGSAICRITMDGKITYANDSFYTILKSDYSDLIGKNYFKICKFHDGINGSQRLRKHVSIDNSYSASITHKNSKGESVYHTCTYVPILDPNGDLLETVCFHHDQSDIHRLNNEIIDTQKELLYTLAEVTEKRSNETGNHIQRVALYSEVLAKAIGLESEAENIKIGSVMHDIGKIAIDDSVLKKPDKLTSSEYEEMKKHSLIGYNILKNSKRPILKTAAIIAREHHERWDGKGYPIGLVGEEIHIYGRIVAIADVFDALGSDRVYKKAWDIERIKEHFKENSGKHFDPELVKVMFENFDKFLDIRDQFVD